MNGKRKYDELLEKDLKAVQTLLQSDTTKRPRELCTLERFPSVQHGEDSLGVGLFGPDLTAVLGAKRNLEKSQRKHVETKEDFINRDELKKVIDEFVEFYERLDNTPIGETSRKPQYSYTELIFLAVMRSSNFCLTIHEIYRYISTRFPYLTRSSERWKNAVRHSLSKTRCFTKIGSMKTRPRSDLLNRSYYLWTIVPRSLLNFARGDYRSSVDTQSGTNILKWAFYQVDAYSFWKKCADSVSKVIQQKRIELEKASTPSSIFDHRICCLPYPQLLENCSPFQPNSREQVCPQSSSSSPANSTCKFRDEHSMAASTLMSISPQPSFLSNPRAGTSAWSSDNAGVTLPNSPPDSGHETLSEFSSPDDLFRQFVLLQSPQLHSPDVSLLNESCHSPWSMMEASFYDTNNLTTMPTLPTLSLACNPDETENPFNVYNYLPLIDSLVTNDCMAFDSRDLSEANSLFADNSAETDIPDSPFTDM